MINADRLSSEGDLVKSFEEICTATLRGDSRFFIPFIFNKLVNRFLVIILLVVRSPESVFERRMYVADAESEETFYSQLPDSVVLGKSKCDQRTIIKVPIGPGLVDVLSPS